MEDPSYSTTAKIIALVMMIIIIISTLCFILESEVCQADTCSGTTGSLEFEPWAMIFYVIEWISVVIFTIDYVVRLSTCPKPLIFLFGSDGVMNLVDLVAFLPFWIMGLMQDPAFAQPSLDSANSVGGVGFVRAVRLIRVFRVFKVGKYSLGIQMFGGAIARSTQPMLILVLVLNVAMIIFSSIIWLIERPGGSLVTDELLSVTGMGPCTEISNGVKNGTVPADDCMQAICFGTIPSAFWWALTTMTTVGYGDCYPITGPGKLVCVVAMIMGVIVLALPITVLGSNFAKMVEMYEEDAAAYHFSDLDDDGLVDELELREFLAAKKKEGLLRKDIDVKVSTLMKKYDSEEVGCLNLMDFRRLQADVVIQRVFDPTLEIQIIKEMLLSHQQALKSLQTSVDSLVAAQAPEGGKAVDLTSM